MKSPASQMSRSARGRAAALALLLALLAPAVRAAGAPAAATAGERLALYTKPAVVRMVVGFLGKVDWRGGPGPARTYDVWHLVTGSGAFIDPDGYVVTNAHVTQLSRVGDDAGKELLFRAFVAALAKEQHADPAAWLNDPERVKRILRRSDLTAFKPVHHVFLPNGTVLPYEMKAFGAPVGQGKDVAIVKVEVKNAPIVKIGDSEALQLLDHVTVVGYPGAADTFESGILSETSTFEASITDGKVSAKKRTADAAPVLQISAPATHGNSGGPVMNDGASMVGLLTFGGDTVNGQEVSGFAFVVPSSTVLEFVRQAGAVNELSATDLLFREGLALQAAGRHAQAIAKFDEVKRLFPQHSEVDRLVQTSQEALSRGEGEPDGGWAVLIGLFVIALGFALLLLVALGGAGLLWYLRPRKAEAPARAAGQSSAAPTAVTERLGGDPGGRTAVLGSYTGG